MDRYCVICNNRTGYLNLYICKSSQGDRSIRSIDYYGLCDICYKNISRNFLDCEEDRIRWKIRKIVDFIEYNTRYEPNNTKTSILYNFLVSLFYRNLILDYKVFSSYNEVKNKILKFLCLELVNKELFSINLTNFRFADIIIPENMFML